MSNRLALTFDNGPTPGVTEPILDVLHQFEVSATFFAIGKKLATPEGRALAARCIAAGHRLGGHTWSHSVPFGVLDDAAVRGEIRRTSKEVAAAGGDRTLFRPYGAGGVIDDRLMSDFGAGLLAAGGFTCVLWTCVPGDWRDQRGWVDVAVDAVRATAWSVVVLHDVAGAALPRLGEFLGIAMAAGVQFTLETPDSCTPIRGGVPTSSLAMLGANLPGAATSR